MTLSPLLLAIALGPQVWIVDDDGGPGVDFLDLQPAVDAAADGDTLLVKEGLYGGFILDGKGLHVVAELGETAHVDDGQVIVRGLAAGQAVVLRGLEVHGPHTGGSPLSTEAAVPLHLEACMGSIWIEASRFTASPLGAIDPPFGLGNAPGALVEDCASAVFADCRLEGILGFFFLGPPGPAGDRGGLALRSSHVSLFDCELVGGGGPGGPSGSSGCALGDLAGAGATVESGTLYAAGSTLQGGPGGKGVDSAGFLWPGAGGSGGHGLWLLAGAPASAELLDCVLSGGPGGPGGTHIDGQPTCPPGPAGSSLATQGHPVTVFNGVAPSLSAESPVRTGQTASVALGGEPFDTVLVAAALLPAAVPVPGLSGVLHLASPWFVLPPVVLDGGGKGTLPIPVPPNPAGFEAALFRLQSAHVTAQLAVVLGPVTTLSTLDPAAAP